MFSVLKHKKNYTKITLMHPSMFNRIILYTSFSFVINFNKIGENPAVLIIYSLQLERVCLSRTFHSLIKRVWRAQSAFIMTVKVKAPAHRYCRRKHSMTMVLIIRHCHRKHVVEQHGACRWIHVDLSLQSVSWWCVSSGGRVFPVLVGTTFSWSLLSDIETFLYVRTVVQGLVVRAPAAAVSVAGSPLHSGGSSVLSCG